LELDPSEVKANDRFILSSLFKEFGTSNSMAFSSSNNFFTSKENLRGGSNEKKINFFTFVIHKAESLSQGAFAALRRTLEKYSSQIKVIMVCKSLGKIIPAIK
jgi:replication factor C subunit 3/5